MRYLVSRHQGALEWFARQGVPIDEVITHFDPAYVQAGDEVVGILPVQLAAQVCERGGRYIHLEMNVPPQWRGKELSAEQMDAFGACLVEYRIERV